MRLGNFSLSLAVRDVADVVFREALGTMAAAGAEQLDADFAVDDVVPLVSRRVPVQFA